jgi:hypothetical protein
MGSSALRRLPFLAAIALVSAAIGDACVESISNTGVFGTGYFDDNQLSVVPTLLAGALLVLEVIAARCIDIVRGVTRARNDDWLVSAASSISARPPVRDLPLVFAMQIVALFGMESIERIVIGGHAEFGLAWLGAPIVFGLAAHFAVCVSGAMLLTWLTKTIVATFASLVRIVVSFIILAHARTAPLSFFDDLDIAAFLRALSAHARHIGGRAPPPLLSLA